MMDCMYGSFTSYFLPSAELKGTNSLHDVVLQYSKNGAAHDPLDSLTNSNRADARTFVESN